MTSLRVNMASLSRLWVAWGWPGALGLFALFIAAGLLFWTSVWEANEADELSRIDDIRSSQRQRKAIIGRQEETTRLRVSPSQWVAGLPDSAHRQERLGDLLETAIRSGLVVDRTEHALVVDASHSLERMRVTMPLSGPYAQVRLFIDTALRQDPGLSLDSLKLRRASIATGDVSADLIWTLHARRVARVLPASPAVPASAAASSAQLTSTGAQPS